MPSRPLGSRRVKGIGMTLVVRLVQAAAWLVLGLAVCFNWLGAQDVVADALLWIAETVSHLVSAPLLAMVDAVVESTK